MQVHAFIAAVSVTVALGGIASCASTAESPLEVTERLPGQRSGAPSGAVDGRAGTDTLLVAEPAGWLKYGRDDAETHFSPLREINSESVHRLDVLWSSPVASDLARIEATPIVSDGVIYATAPWSIVFALEAQTGAVKWRWDPKVNRYGRAAGGPSICCGPVNRGVALYGGTVFLGVLDGRLVALDAETGRVIWERQTTPPGSDYSVTGAPRVVDGKVIIGNSGAEFGVRGYVTAYDAESGEQAWRFYTVPGDPSQPFESPAMELAATTWTGEWWELGGGGTVWDAMAFDAEAKLLYVGVGNGSPWNQVFRSPEGGDNLFLASIVALDPEDGSLAWYYQTTPGEQWDYGATQSMVLASIQVDGNDRQVLMQASKNGFFYVLDRHTGELISANPFADVSWAHEVDEATGRPREAPGARYDVGGAWLSPGPAGAHTWAPMAWSPDTRLAYIPGQNTLHFYRSSADFDFQAGRYNTGVGGVGPSATPRPQADGPLGFLLAWDPERQQERWRVPLDTQKNGGVLATGGNLVFMGTWDGRFQAYDASSGRKLWEFDVGPGPGTPVSYEVNGVQVITVLAGERAWTFALTPEA